MSAASDEKSEELKIDFGSEVDLHHFHPRDTGKIIDEFFSQAEEKGISRLRIIHGKGRSQKKIKVYSILEKHPKVVSFRDDGSNWGATIVIMNWNENYEE